MRLSVGMDAIGLEPTLGIGHVGNAFEEEGYQTRFVLLCPSAEGLGGHAPMGAFNLAADAARILLNR